MAFGFGVGDILMLTDLIINTIQDIRNAPDELLELADRVESIESTLEIFDDLAEANKVVAALADQDLLARSRNTARRKKARVKEVLSVIQTIVLKYKEPGYWINRLKYITWDKRTIPDLEAKLKLRTDDLTTFLTIQNGLLTSQLRPLIEKVLANQEKQRQQEQNRKAAANDARHFRLVPDSQNIIPSQVDRIQEVLSHVLQKERPTILGQDEVSLESDIKTQLEQAGYHTTSIEALMEMITKQRELLSHPEDIDPISYTGGRRRLEAPKGWIMVVDKYNEVRSIIAQTYLELLRVWTVNSTGEWLYNRVESANIQIETKFSLRSARHTSMKLKQGGVTPESAALKAIAGENSYFRSAEKDDILARISEHRSRGIDNWHFRKYEYMLCFDKHAFKALNVLAQCCKERYGNNPSYAWMPKIILLKHVKLNDAAANLSGEETWKMVEDIKKGIEDFLQTEYQWKEPSYSMCDGPFRTKQVALLTDNIKYGSSQRDAKLNDIATNTGCRIRVTDEKFDHQLFSITGPKKALPHATSLLVDSLVGGA